MVSQSVPRLRYGLLLVRLLQAVYDAYLGRIMSRFEVMLLTSLPRLGVPTGSDGRLNTH